jgi:hypothetical protein
MRRAFGFSLSLIALVSLLSSDTLAASSNKSLATITGSVRDNRGNPLAGALVSLIRDGVKTVKEARTDKQGNFIAKISPGRYGIKAIAIGFSEVAFNEVDVKASQELVYRFNLEPVGHGNTLPERRRDRDEVKWALRSAQPKRSIFQNQEGEDSTVAAVTAATETAQMETAPDAPIEAPSDSRPKTHGVLESYFANSGFGSSYVGVNFAVATPVSDQVELIFSGQTGTADAPERVEATTLFRIGERHRVGVTAAGVRFGTRLDKQAKRSGKSQWSGFVARRRRMDRARWNRDRSGARLFTLHGRWRCTRFHAALRRSVRRERAHACEGSIRVGW